MLETEENYIHNSGYSPSIVKITELRMGMLCRTYRMDEIYIQNFGGEKETNCKAYA
jgi:hypothetical protein